MNSARKRPRPTTEDGGGGGGEAAPFVAADSFQGSRPGYVFRQGDHGVGYYRDVHDDKKNKTNNDQNENDITKPRRKGVRIAEERNETRTYETADALLAQAEEAAAASGQQQRVLDLRNPASLRHSLKAWHKATVENELQRAQYPDDPAQFMDSEVALYEHVHAWMAIAAEPDKFYPILWNSSDDGLNVTNLLNPLLQHVNTDVSRATINLLLEWFDPTLLVQSKVDDDNNDDDGAEVVVQAVMKLASLVLEEGLFDLVIANLGRFASEDADKDAAAAAATTVGRGVWDILGLVENFMEMESMLATTTAPNVPRRTLQTNGTASFATYLVKETTILGWLLAAIDPQMKSSPYRERALEVLVLLAPLEDIYNVLPDWTKIPPYTSVFVEDDDNDNKNKNKRNKAPEAAKLDGIEILLQTVAGFRKEQPSNSEDLDLLENAAMVMNSVLTYSKANTAAFVQAQGIELVVRCCKERVHAAGVALPWLDVGGTEDVVYRQACERMLQAKLLKYLMPFWMGRALPSSAHKTAKAQKTYKHQIEQCTIRIVYALTRHLQPDSPEDAQQRLVAKFAVDPPKLERLVSYLISYDQKARAAEYKFYRSDVEESLGEDAQAIQLAALEAKLSAGGDLFHRLGAICAFLCTQSKQCHKLVLEYLQAKQAGMGLVRAAVEEFATILEADSPQRLQLEAYLEAL